MATFWVLQWCDGASWSLKHASHRLLGSPLEPRRHRRVPVTPTVMMLFVYALSIASWVEVILLGGWEHHAPHQRFLAHSLPPAPIRTVIYAIYSFSSVGEVLVPAVAFVVKLCHKTLTHSHCFIDAKPCM